MPRVRLVDGSNQAGEEKLQMTLRPARLEEYIGQNGVKEKLTIALAAAREREEPLEHTLLYGPPGLGKTTLAYIIAGEMKSNIVCSSGPAIERSGDLMGILTNLEGGDVLFIDEIHRLPRAVEEFLYPAMEDFRLDFVVDKGPFARSIKVTLRPFTLVGATTRAGLLSGPLRDRFGLAYHLDFYAPEDLETIISRSARILGLELLPEAAGEIAGRARGTPRVANRLLKRVRDYAQVKAGGIATREVACSALELEGIDAVGLDALDRRYLNTVARVYRGGPVGVEALAATMNEEVDTLEDLVEPYLLKTGFIARTPAGRRITHLGVSNLPDTDEFEEGVGGHQGRLF